MTPGRAAGCGTITASGSATPLAVERLTYHALLAGLQVLLAEGLEGALTIAAAPAFIVLLRPPISPTIQTSSGCDGMLPNCSMGSGAN